MQVCTFHKTARAVRISAASKIKESTIMKIGVLTYFWDENPGTILQAYCLSGALSSFFKTAHVDIINYRHARHFYLIRNYLKIRRVYEDYTKKNIYHLFKKKYLNLSSNELISGDIKKSSEFIKSQEYDLIVVGSDTVWQVTKNKKLPGFPNIYWLPERLGQTKQVTFAVSANITRVAGLSVDEKNKMAECLDRFELIGVRDCMTYELVKNIYGPGNKLVNVADPTFAYEPPLFDASEILIKKGVDLQKPLLAINYPARAPFCREIVAHYRSMGFQIVSLTTGFPYADYQVPCLDPFQWASMFRNFSFVITDRFHGTIFSLKNNVPVLSVDWHPFRSDIEGNSKTLSLMKEFGLEKTNHINLCKQDIRLTSFIEQAERAKNNFDSEKVSGRIKLLKDSCSQYFKKVEEVIS